MSQSQSAFAITPVNLNGADPQGSKAVPIAVNWQLQHFAPDGTQSISINLLQQYQSGQFTAIQAVWIDNTNNYFAVDLVALETGERIRCPGLSQGMFPIFSAAAPVFTLTNEIGGLSGLTLSLAGKTQVILLNTPQRYFVSKPLPVFRGGAGTASTTLTVVGNAPNIINNPLGVVSGRFMRLTGFRLTLYVQNALAAADGYHITLVYGSGGIAGAIFTDTVTLAAGAIRTVYDSGSVNFPEPLLPNSGGDLYGISVGTDSGTYPGGGVICQLSYYFDFITLG